MNKYLKANRDHWNELVRIHGRSAFYDVEGFKVGRSTLGMLYTRPKAGGGQGGEH